MTKDELIEKIKELAIKDHFLWLNFHKDAGIYINKKIFSLIKDNLKFFRKPKEDPRD